MFEVYCPSHGSRVLLSTSRIEAMHNTRDGIVVEWRCWCGEHGTTGTPPSSTPLPRAS
jgi:hypothetical protein